LLPPDDVCDWPGIELEPRVESSVGDTGSGFGCEHALVPASTAAHPSTT
jgi:hypothetical protein